MNRLLALDLKPVNAMEQFALGQQQAQRGQMNALGMQRTQQQLDQGKLDQSVQAIQMIGSGALAAMGGDINGTAHPEKFDSIINDFVNLGVKEAEQFRGRSDVAPQLARMSVTTMDQLNRAKTDRDHDLAMDKFNLDVRRLHQTKAPSGYRGDENGNLSAIPGGPADPANPLNRKRLQDSNSVTVQPDGTVIVGGTSPSMGRKATGKLQDGVISSTLLLDQMDKVEKSYNPEFLTYQGKGEAFFTAQSEKLGMSVGESKKQFLKGKTTFVTGVERLFNAYRKDITGAAAAVQELERLKKSFINADMSPSEFEAAFEAYNTELRRSLRLRRKLLRVGLDPRTKEGGSKFDELFLTGGDDEIEERGNELQNKGMDEKQILAQLRREGYGG